MIVSRTLLICLIVVPLAAGGCRSTSWGSKGGIAESDPAPASLQREGSHLGSPPASHSVQQASSQLPSVAGPEAASVMTDEVVLRELQTISAVDPVAAQQLIHHLQEVKPTLRPLAAQQFRASWQYHRELTSAGGATPDAPFGPTAPVMSPSVISPSPLPSPTQSSVQPAPEQMATPVTPPTTEGMGEASSTEPQVAAPAPAEVQQAGFLDSGAEPAEKQAAETLAQPEPAATPSDDLDWNEAVDRAITHLAEVTPAEPHSTAQAYQHARLRLLQLIAGSEEAMSPIPGLTPTEQGYWSNQLFALQTLLDHAGEMNEQQRAALARSHLGDADTKLGEVAALSVLNLTFCSEVLAYGNYKPIPKPSFRAGQSVRLYAEIENFRSERTETGYHASLATSYEIHDMNGNRVAEGEFATVDDYCQRKRRDFYMEFSFDLPNRIYANRYKLQVLVRDRLSGKLGKSTVEFEIAD